jgi:hypothetical protein
MSKFAEISDSNHGAHLSSMVSHCRFSQMGHLKSVQHHAVVPNIGLRLSFAYLLVPQGSVTLTLAPEFVDVKNLQVRSFTWSEFVGLLGILSLQAQAFTHQQYLNDHRNSLEAFLLSHSFLFESHLTLIFPIFNINQKKRQKQITCNLTSI